MYYVLVNNEIHNLLQFTIHALLTKNAQSSVYLFESKFAHFYSKMNCAGPEEAVFEYG